MITWLFPERCPVCMKLVVPRGNQIHTKCAGKLAPITEPCCKKCGKPIADESEEYCEECDITSFAWDYGHCLYRYHDITKRAILQVKEEGTKEFVRFFGRGLAEHYKDFLHEIKPDCIVPVPLHKGKLRRRGFNQAELLAAELSNQIGIPIILLLTKKKKTKDQKTLSKEQRKRNLFHAFVINTKSNLSGMIPRSVLLVDDVYTTGSTMNACATVLKQAGVSFVYFLCVCSNVLEDT